MSISDWSSGVCSSDLWNMRHAMAVILAPPVRGAKTQRAARGAALWRVVSDCPRREAATVTGSGGDGRTVVVGADRDLVLRLLLLEKIGRASWRERQC